MITIVRLLDGATLADACRITHIPKKSIAFIVPGNSRISAPPNARDYRIVTFDGKTATVEFVRDGRIIGGVKLEHCRPR